MSDRTKLLEEISRLAAEYWEKRQAPYLLSSLGPDLRNKGFDFQTIIKPLRLRQFVEYFLEDSFRVISDPDVPLKIGMVPKNILASKDVSELFRKTKNDVSFDHGVRLKPSIFSAFVKDLPSGYKRYVDTKVKNFRFKDLREGEEVGKDFVELDPALIVTEFDSSPKKKDELSKNFEVWLTKYKLKRENFLFASNAVERNQSLLTGLLERLPESDLSRISMPLDIIKKLSGI